MAYTTQQALETLNGYMSITDSQKEVIDDTKKRGYVVTLNSGEKVVIFVYPLVHKQDNTKNYFDTRDSGAYERGVAWRYALSNGLKYFCFGINDQVAKYSDYIFSLECNESVIEQISGTKNGSRNGPGNQIIIPNDYIPSKKYERIKNKLGIYISVIQKDVLFDYMQMYDNRPYLPENIMETEEPIDEYQRASQIISDYITETGLDVPNNKEAENETLIEFKERFSPDVLEKLSDNEILQKLFYTSGDNTEALCYWLEHNAACREYFGSIAGGSSYKFGLFQKKDTGDWMTGSPQKPQVLTENQALETGKKIRDALIKGAEIIKNSTLESLSDFEKVDDELKNVIGEQYYNLSWFHKYFFMICPDKLSGFHSNDWQNHVLRCLRIVPSEKYYARSMQIAKVENYTNLSYSEFFSVIYDEFGNIKNFVRLGTRDSEKSYITEWQRKSVVGIGWREVGTLDDYVAGDGLNKDAITERLMEIYYPDDRKTASRKAGELIRFYKTDADTVFVTMDGESLISFVDEIGNYFYDSSTAMSHMKMGKWHNRFTESDILPEKSEGKLTSCYQLTDEKNLMFLYEKYYYGEEAESEELDNSEAEVTYMPLVFNTEIETKYERNRIVFGAPGTGKSYELKEDCEKLLKDTNGSYERVTFHPDYSYSQFVGTYKPVMGADEKIRYDFVPGPFMRVYVDALKSGRTENPQPHLLLIEEINRAKVAAVFGDVFQLLDRDDDGVSEYEIQASEDIRKYLASKLGGAPDNYQKIRIPNNMFIWSTMNSADQGVFPMDTAFKRRWNFEYLGINENEEKISGIGKIELAGSDEPVEWNILRRAINAKMSSEQFKINEDKLMGPFFLSKKIIASDENGMIIDTDKFVAAFKSKVIMYLYEDAVKQGKHRFFDGCDNSKYSSVCEAFDELGMGIFGPNFKENFYDKQRDEA
ncbi:AAA family ATPase [Jutongia sp.]